MQSVQPVDRCPDHRPGGQTSHTADPGASANRPSVQLAHTDGTVAPTASDEVPAGHAVHGPACTSDDQGEREGGMAKDSTPQNPLEGGI